MPALVSVTIKNLDAIRLAYANSPVKMQSELGRAIQRTVLTIESRAKKEAPVNKQSGGGNLRQSIRSGMSGLMTGFVEVGAEYGIYVHEGTRPHQIVARNKRVLANKRSGDVFGRVVNHPGTKANPFLQRAVDASESDIDGYFINAVLNVFK